MTISQRIARLWDLAGVYRDRRIAAVVVLGIASGLPSPLLAANLSIRLADEGFSRTAVAAFGAVAAPYAVNFLWAPVFDRLPPPLFGGLGRRRGWLVWTLSALIAALALLATREPAGGLAAMAMAAVLVAFVSASLDVVVDAYRIEILDPSRMAAGSAAAILGWHLGGTVIGGAGGLLLAARFGWEVAYLVLAGVLLFPLAAAFVIREPAVAERPGLAGKGLRAALVEAVAEPLAKLTERPLWAEILAFIVLFKLGDAMLGRMSGVFYREMGFDYVTIAEVSKVYGIGATVLGGVLGGVALKALGSGRGLFVAGLAMSATNLLFSGLAADPGRAWFVGAVVGDGLTSGFATVAFVAFLSRLCDAGHAATQYALLASIGNLARLLLAGVAGWMVDRLGGDWQVFFVLTAILAVPGLAILAHILAKTRMGDGLFSRTDRMHS
jgi:PAT family beta-lactamase induction signal transducer AmpG